MRRFSAALWRERPGGTLSQRARFPRDLEHSPPDHTPRKRDRAPALHDAIATATCVRTFARLWSASAPAALFGSALASRDVSATSKIDDMKRLQWLWRWNWPATNSITALILRWVSERLEMGHSTRVTQAVRRMIDAWKIPPIHVHSPIAWFERAKTSSYFGDLHACDGI